jgi:predicted ATP-dependent endonuclease of OLD family
MKEEKEHIPYLKSVSLKGYKSIKDVSVDFEPGLNIIIGKNASGKTNFLECLKNTLLLKKENFHQSTLVFNVNQNDFISVRQFKDKKDEEDLFTPSIIEINGNKVLRNGNNEIHNEINLRNGTSISILHCDTSLIIYDKKDLFLVSDSFDIEADLNEFGVYEMLSDIYKNEKTLLEIDFILALHKAHNEIRGNREELSIEKTKLIIDTRIEEVLGRYKKFISYFEPIKDIRLNKNFVVRLFNGDSGKYEINNLQIEFLIGNNWHSYKLLSDGTKRLFYILSEFSFKERKEDLSKEYLDIILIEEPELGIHPHQLHQLMLFLKEMAKERQIILTTHSPQVLDILGADELNKIIIAEYDDTKGTTMRHLTDKEKTKATVYMKNKSSLSDYWRYSDLES